MTFEEMQEVLRQIVESQRQAELWHEQISRDIEGLLAVQRELQESDLRAREEREIAREEREMARQERAEMDRRIAALLRIVEHWVGNAEVVDRIQTDHEDRIRQLEQE
jgi:hypothetical protein